MKIIYSNTTISFRDPLRVFSAYEINHAIFEAARALGITVSFYDSGNPIDLIIKKTRHLGMNGILATVPWTMIPHTHKIMRLAESIPFVNMLIDSPDANANYVGNDIAQSASLIVDHFYNEGFRKIGIFSLGFERYSLAAYSGYRTALSRCGLPFDPRWTFSDTPLEKLAHDGIEGFHNENTTSGDVKLQALSNRLLSMKSPPDAILFVGPYYAYRFWELAEKMGILIPHTIGIAAIGSVTTVINEYEGKPLTLSTSEHGQIGTMALSLLMDIITRKRPPNGQRILIPSRLIVRESSLKSSIPQSKGVQLKTRIANYLNDHLAEKNLMEITALHFDMGYKAFSRDFKRLFSTGFQRYVINMRLTRAAFNLEHTTKPVGDILFDVGYRYHQKFNREFKIRYGLSPEHYRSFAHRMKRVRAHVKRAHPPL